LDLELYHCEGTSCEEKKHCRILQRLLDRIAGKRKRISCVSSEYCCSFTTLEDTIKAMGDKQIVKRTGYKTKPWGTPQEGRGSGTRND